MGRSAGYHGRKYQITVSGSRVTFWDYDQIRRTYDFSLIAPVAGLHYDTRGERLVFLLANGSQWRVRPGVKGDCCRLLLLHYPAKCFSPHRPQVPWWRRLQCWLC
jgi:hypothetical protein